MIMRVLIDITSLVGLGTSGAFLMLFRPSSYRSALVINALGLSITLFLIFFSTLFLVVFGGDFLHPVGHDFEQIVYLALRFVGDLVLIGRLVTFVRFRRDYDQIHISYGDSRESSR